MAKHDSLIPRGSSLTQVIRTTVFQNIHRSIHICQSGFKTTSVFRCLRTFIYAPMMVRQEDSCYVYYVDVLPLIFRKAYRIEDVLVVGICSLGPLQKVIKPLVQMMRISGEKFVDKRYITCLGTCEAKSITLGVAMAQKFEDQAKSLKITNI